MRWALVDKENICQNVIVYDPDSDYEPAEGLKLLEVNDWINIGDSIDKSEPQPPPVDDAERKAERNKRYSGDMAIVGAYEIEKKSNPNLDFSDYLDSLEGKINKS